VGLWEPFLPLKPEHRNKTRWSIIYPLSCVGEGKGKGMTMVSGSSSSIRQQSVCSSVKLRGTKLNSHLPLPSQHSLIPIYHNTHPSPVLRTRFHLTVVVPKASSGSYSPADDDGVSLGTMKLPINLDLQRFDSLLFQVNPFTHFIFYCYVN
jgi:hypothetical protein